MWQILFAVLALAWTLLPAGAEVLTFSCDGTTRERDTVEPITKMGLIVNLDARVVTGLAGIIAAVDDIDANTVSFRGESNSVRYRGKEALNSTWYLNGTIDRITGSVEATVMGISNSKNNSDYYATYELLCKPTRPLF